MVALDYGNQLWLGVNWTDIRKWHHRQFCENLMTNQSKKFAKKKKRENRAKARVQAKRAANLKKKKAERERVKTEHKFREKGYTIRNNTDINSPAEIKRRLEYNLKILKALEEEYVQEMASKEGVAEELEKAGYNTIEEKLQALTDRAREIAGTAEDAVGEMLLQPEFAEELRKDILENPPKKD